LIPNLAYSLYLLQRNRSWIVFSASRIDVSWPALMAMLWMGAFALYGVSSVLLGALGTSAGWGLFQVFMIRTATLSGLLTAEWENAPRHARILLGTGLLTLVGATLLLSLGSR
jgi:L-rhamnose-H+ transport protein